MDSQEFNRHDDHYASCLCCRELVIEFDAGYSDVTPGVGWYTSCRKGHFYFTGEGNTEEMHKTFTQGLTCPDFFGK